jgi:hypothetical protein
MTPSTPEGSACAEPLGGANKAAEATAMPKNRVTALRIFLFLFKSFASAKDYAS